MSLTLQIAERYEGGHWYVVEAYDDGHGLTLPPSMGLDWSATYAEIDGTTWAVVRAVEPKMVGRSARTVAAVLAASAAQGLQPDTKKHHWRIGGA